MSTIMKKYLIFPALLALPFFAGAQSSLQGAWQGNLKAGSQDVRIVFHLKGEENGRLSGTMDSPDQGSTGIPCDSIYRRGDSLFVSIMQGRAHYEGRISGDTLLKGTWVQGIRIPLEMRRTEKPAQLSRPQTPHAPFPYYSEDLSFYNADKSIRFGATLTAAASRKPAPAVLLISGSGPQDRNEDLFGHQPFAVIADYLSRKGYTVLRVDDRGVGQTTGDRSKATTFDFAKDATAALDYLKTRKEVNKSRVGLLGHSEGGMIAPMIATQRKDVAFVILMAAPGIPILQLMEDQNAAMMRTGGVNDEFINKYRTLYSPLVQTILRAPDTTRAMSESVKLIHDWRAANPDVANLVGITDYETEQEHARAFIQSLQEPWFRTFFTIDPQKYLEQLSCKVLALNGEKDAQVTSAENLAGIRKSLAKSKATTKDVVELLGLNHLFQTCTKCNVMEYKQLEETISPIALKTIGDWMDKNLKK